MTMVLRPPPGEENRGLGILTQKVQMRVETLIEETVKCQNLLSLPEGETLVIHIDWCIKTYSKIVLFISHFPSGQLSVNVGYFSNERTLCVRHREIQLVYVQQLSILTKPRKYKT